MVDEVTREVAKQLAKGVYDDTASGALKEGGSFFTDLIKAARYKFTQPLQEAAAKQDKYRQFLEDAIVRVPEGLRIQPAPQILGPVLDGIEYETEDSPLVEMFSNLLAKAMNKEEVHQAHPAFAKIIQQLSPDEAVILKELECATPTRIYTVDYDKKARRRVPGTEVVELDEFPSEKLLYPGNLRTDIDHLESLGLARFDIRNCDSPHEIDEDTHKYRYTGNYTLLAWGDRFVKACLAPSPK